MNFKKNVTLLVAIMILPIVSCGQNGGIIIDKNTEIINIVAFNDFHGAIYPEGSRMGLLRLGSYLKEQSQNPNTLILSQGDDWQGSIYSNYNHGQLINDVYAYVHMSARTVGNHDFDWGIDKVIENTAREYDGYVTPVLAANIYDYDFTTKTVGDIQQDSVGRQSITYTLENGLKVGIVGVIGESQITTITSSYTENICFTNHIEVIKNEAIRLRNYEKCDVVIATVHGGEGDVKGNALSDYVDLVLCGHTHRLERSSENGVVFAQFGAYGEYVGNIRLAYNKKDKRVTRTTVEVLDYSNIDTKIDTHIQSLIEEYSNECNDSANEVVANKVTNYFDQYEQSANLMCKAMYDQAINEGHDDIILSYCNNARHYLPYGSWTYADLYESFPFDNTVYIVEVTGADIYKEIYNYNCVYFNPTFNRQVNRYQKYKIAVLDYLLYHTNDRRYYDYFSSFTGTTVASLQDNYRIILKNWLKNNGYNDGKSIDSRDYSSSLYEYDGKSLTMI